MSLAPVPAALRGLAARLRALLFPAAVARELEEELRFHLDRETERHVALGLSQRDAALAARRSVGNLALHREAARDAYGWRWLDELAQDLRYATRALRRSPGLTAAAVLSLALVVGANTAAFGAVDALLLRRLPVREPQRLVTLEQVGADGTPWRDYAFSDYERFRQLDDAFAGVYATTWADGFDVVAGGPPGGGQSEPDPRPARISVVTGDFFDVLGVRARLGRALRPDDDVDGALPVVVISDAYWTRRFAHAPDVVGRTLAVRGATYTVVGVAPRGFAGDWVGWPTDMWVPVAMVYRAIPMGAASGPRGGRLHYKLVARLRDGVSVERARAAGAVVHARIAADAPAGSAVDGTARFALVSAAAGYSTQREEWRQPLVLVGAVVAVVLLVACANVANLLLARAAARQRELTVRAAIGACRARLARQLLTESLLLAALGGAGGLLVARLGAAVLDGYARSAPAGSVMFGAAALALDLRPDARVLAFDGAVCLVTGVLFGLAPALRASRRLPVGLLVWRGSGASRATAAGRATGLRSSLVVGQIALSLVLLAGAALLVRSLHNIRASVAGFDREQLLLVWTLPGYGTRDRAASRALFAQVESRIAALPGVVSASPSVDGIFGASPASPIPTRPEGAGVAPLVHARGLMTVGPGFFRTVGQRLIAGRDFGAADADSSPRVVIVDEQLARRAFGTLDVLGRRVGIGGERSAPAYTVVGVVGDAKYASPHDAGGMLVYFPYAQSRNLARLCLVVRVSRGAEQVERAIREELRRIDPLLPVLEIDTVDEQLDHALSRDRLVTQLSLFFGGLAALLACVGLYGLVAYTTARRTSEIGVRVALGATRGGVLRLVLADGVRLVGTGIALGVAAAAGATRLVASRLYGIGAGDPLTIAGIAALLVAVAALATYLPARRAADADPTAALRVE